jgi:hypothetical protein
MRIAGPATEETWVGDAEGDPVMVITAAPSQSLAAELARLLPDLRALIGPDRRCTVVFDRGGYSPAVFTEIITAGFDLLTDFKGAWAHSPLDTFQVVDFTAPTAPPRPMSSPKVRSTCPSQVGAPPPARTPARSRCG